MISFTALTKYTMSLKMDDEGDKGFVANMAKGHC
jgi:hypothetical protein